MGRGAVLEHKDELVLGAIEAAHARVGLVPYAKVLELCVDGPSGGQELP